MITGKEIGWLEIAQYTGTLYEPIIDPFYFNETSISEERLIELINDRDRIVSKLINDRDKIVPGKFGGRFSRLLKFLRLSKKD